jgi:hypothetical protein
MRTCLVVIMVVCCILVSPIFAQDNPPAGTNSSTPTPVPTPTPTPVPNPAVVKNGPISMEEVMNILIVFLVLSIVFEVALTPIFNWRIFLIYFDERGFKTPITVGLAFLVFWGYKLDIITDLLNVLKPLVTNRESNIGGKILTALLIAGGSSGIFQIFTKLGIRNPVETKEKGVEARATKAAETRAVQLAKQQEREQVKNDKVEPAHF